MADMPKSGLMSTSKPQKAAASSTDDPSNDRRGRAFVPKREERTHDPAHTKDKEVQYRKKHNGPVMKVKITDVKKELDRYLYQVKDSDGKPVTEGGEEAVWIPEEKLIPGT